MNDRRQTSKTRVSTTPRIILPETLLQALEPRARRILEENLGSVLGFEDCLLEFVMLEVRTMKSTSKFVELHMED
ncbi:hypothetical protein KM043_001128 [Ampulex compressa]|nr:hypothetical protein KM043_001128 [Ampulex compressa]